MYMIIAYDIADSKRLLRVAKIMEDYGQRVQYSIFEAALSPLHSDMMQRRVEKVINKEFDGVKYYPLCEKCLQRAVVLGIGGMPGVAGEYLVL